MRNIKFKVDMPVLSSVVHVCVGNKDWREKFTWRMRLDADNCTRNGFCAYREALLGAEVCIVMSEDCIATFAHEAVHAANYIQQHMHRPPSWEDDELTAYIVGYLVGIYLKKREAV